MKRTPSTIPPPIDPATVEWLDALFPERCPDPADSERAVWMAVGARQVVRKIRSIMEAQQKNILNVHRR
jgi:hypothetical protein